MASLKEIHVVGTSTDVWMAESGEEFSSFHVSFISKDLNLENVVLGSSVLRGIHTGRELSDMFINIMRKFKPNSKLGFISTDWGSSAKREVKLTSEEENTLSNLFDDPRNADNMDTDSDNDIFVDIDEILSFLYLKEDSSLDAASANLNSENNVQIPSVPQTSLYQIYKTGDSRTTTINHIENTNISNPVRSAYYEFNISDDDETNKTPSSDDLCK